MSFKSFKLIRLFVPIAILLVVGLLLTPFGSARESLASELMSIAQESLNAQYETLVTGDTAASLKGKRFGPRFRNAIGKQLASQLAMRKALLKTKQDFKNFKTELRLTGLTVNGDTAKLMVTEQTELAMDAPGGPPSMGLIDEHVFEFKNVMGQWELLSDTIPRPSTEPDLSGLDNPRGPRPWASQKRRGQEPMFVKASFASPPTGYDRAAASQYARQYAMGQNPEYIVFGGTDCTNFVSQSLSAGGMPQEYGWYRSEDVWFYSCAIFGQTRATASWTWSKAKLLYNYIMFNTPATDFWINRYPEGANPGLWPGDIVFSDWDGPNGHQPDTQIDHVMFVTGRDTGGNLYISQHSPSRRDQPLLVTKQAEPLAKFEGFHIKDSF